ncbi:MAG: M15 family metallopeptidase [Bacteroidota bacterium]
MIKIRRRGMPRKTRSQNILIIILFVLLAVAFVFSRSIKSGGQSSIIAFPTTNENKQSASATENQSAMAAPESNQKMDIPENLLLGKPTAQQRDSLFVNVAPGFGNRDGLLMHHKAYEAFQEMHEAARADDISLTIISAFRDFSHQQRIWESKWTGRRVLSGNVVATSISDPAERAREILRYSAMPGSSRHHWGTDIDLNSLDNAYFLSGKGKKEYEWLVNNAHRFGFCQPYIARDLRKGMGYEEEKWHWSYMPIATDYLAAYREKITYNDIGGFAGAETAKPIGIIENYVMPIAEKCLFWKEDNPFNPQDSKLKRY